MLVGLKGVGALMLVGLKGVGALMLAPTAPTLMLRPLLYELVYGEVEVSG